MKVQNLNYVYSGTKIRNSYVSKTLKMQDNGNYDINFKQNYTYANLLIRNSHTISFMGKRVYIVDGGNHATNMQHFANAVSDDMDITMKDVEVNYKDKNIKQLKSLEQQLKNLNLQSSFKDEYIAIPALATVAILNIQDQYNRVMDDNKKFTPQNLKANKKHLLSFLEKIYKNPYLYSEYIGYMDSNRQGIEYTYGVIREINKLIAKGAKVYVPSGHPQDETLKWLAGERGLKPELYHLIATGEDKNNQIKKMHEEIKNNNWYDFNLLSLSDANIVGVKGTKGAQDYMFAAYDSCITDGERGVYNFSPVRKDGKLIGYSYTDTTTNEYPYEEFPANDEVANLVKYVGKYYYNVLADSSEIEELRKCKLNNESTKNCADKLYPVNRIFSEDEIKDKKIDLQGTYVDKSLKLFFNTNSNGYVIFPKCDCEGSGKPSVLSMWGSCFSTINAIARDIELAKKNEEAWKNVDYCYQGVYVAYTKLDSEMSRDSKQLENAYMEGDYKQSEYLCNKFLQNLKIIEKNIPDEVLDSGPTGANWKAVPSIGIWRYFDRKMDVYNILVDSLLKQNKYEEAKGVLNMQTDEICQNIFEVVSRENISIKHAKEIINEKEKIIEKNNQARNRYHQAEERWDNSSVLTRFFLEEPKKPIYENEDIVSYYEEEVIKLLNIVIKNYELMSQICEKQGEIYPAKVCKAAAKDIVYWTPRAESVFERRLDKVQYIGDLYEEIKP